GRCPVPAPPASRGIPTPSPSRGSLRRPASFGVRYILHDGRPPFGGLVTEPSAAKARRPAELPAARATPASVRRRIRSLPARFLPDAADGLVAEWELRIDDQAFAVSLSDH